MRDWFAQTDEIHPITRIPVMFNMMSNSVPPMKDQICGESDTHLNPSLSHIRSASKRSIMLDEDSDEDEDQIPDNELEVYKMLFLS